MGRSPTVADHRGTRSSGARLQVPLSRPLVVLVNGCPDRQNSENSERADQIERLKHVLALLGSRPGNLIEGQIVVLQWRNQMPIAQHVARSGRPGLRDLLSHATLR
jgi:hypothetical protein